MLYLVATPIGNLGDISLRALETLRTVDLVASEDTRKTGRLLKHYDIHKPQVAFHEYNEAEATPRIVEVLKDGASVALVANAGTPGISDPGYSLVRAAVEHDLPVTDPRAHGASDGGGAVGAPAHSFVFRGFTPRRSAARQRFYAADAEIPLHAHLLREPLSAARLARDALAVFGNRRAALANDLTKMYEAVERGTLTELIERLRGTPIRGSMCWWSPGRRRRRARRV